VWYPNPNPNQSPPWDEGRSVAAVPRPVQAWPPVQARMALAQAKPPRAAATRGSPGGGGWAAAVAGLRRWLGCGGGWAAAVNPNPNPNLTWRSGYSSEARTLLLHSSGV
jgi:hypothetical protein